VRGPPSEQRIDRWPEAVLARPANDAEAAFGDQDVAIGRRDIDGAGRSSARSQAASTGRRLRRARTRGSTPSERVCITMATAGRKARRQRAQNGVECRQGLRPRRRSRRGRACANRPSSVVGGLVFLVFVFVVLVFVVLVGILAFVGRLIVLVVFVLVVLVVLVFLVSFMAMASSSSSSTSAARPHPRPLASRHRSAFVPVQAYQPPAFHSQMPRHSLGP
jgi:hypothetical protein